MAAENTEKKYKIVLTMENGQTREMLVFDKEGNSLERMHLNEEQADYFKKVVEVSDVDFIRETGLSSLAEKWGPQLALSEERGVRFWITGNPNAQGEYLRVVHIELVKV